LCYNILHVKTKQGVTLIDFAINNNHIDIINLLKSLKQECTLCLATKHYTELYTMNNCNETSGCKFSFCKACLIEHITTHLDDNNTQELKCPNVNCAKKINALDIHAITENRKELYDRFLEVSF